MSRNIGIYGGTFDPIHFGHLNLAIEMMEARNLDEVWFNVAKISPHKLDKEPTDVVHRLKMVELAIAPFSQFRVLDIETKREGPSYTVDTLQELKALNPEKTFHLIIGDDAVSGFFDWRQPQEIIKLAPLLVGCRSSVSPDFFKMEGDPQICKAIQTGLVPTHVLDISSTRIRDRMKSNLYCGHLMPEKVVDYIHTNQLYLS